MDALTGDALDAFFQTFVSTCLDLTDPSKETPDDDVYDELKRYCQRKSMPIISWFTYYTLMVRLKDVTETNRESYKGIELKRW